MKEYGPEYLPPSIRTLMTEMWADIQQSSYQKEKAAALANPQKYKLSRTMSNTNYRYYTAGKNGRGQPVRFCYATHRNVAGFFLGWREVITKKEGRRDQWCARRKRHAVEEIARRRAAKFRERATSSAPPQPPG